MNHEFRSEHPHQGNRSAFRRSVAPGDFHLKGTSGVTRSLSRLYTGRDQYETAFEIGFLFLAFNISSLKWRNSTRELGFSIVLSAALERVIIFNMHCVDVLFCSVNNPFFRERLQTLLKSHRFIGSEPYPLPSPRYLRAQAGLLNFWK